MPIREADGGMFLMGNGNTVYRFEGALAMAVASALWRCFADDPSLLELQLQAVANMTRNMGKAMENYIRSTLQTVSAADSDDLLHGTVFGPTPYVQIRWAWLVFLVVELALSTVFLVGTIAVTKMSRLQIVKSSSLATMCALDGHTRRHLSDINDLASVEEQARKTDVRLERSVSGLAMWLTMARARDGDGAAG